MNPFRFSKNFSFLLLGAWPVIALLVACWAALSTLMYFFGFTRDAASQDFFTTLYFSAITALTVGYGDISPGTAIGRVLAVALGLLGIVLTGVVVAAALRAIESTANGEDLWKSKSSAE
ncbi:potassium channel family protein [Pseudoxanthomonas mexicana]|uniref:potassium channel family protein n=1 Tax=Pseudoxanthomonas mexicana TaxID=128785 RepID=UPI0022F387A0|nr:potassium channel family protein [Pseudoxanthomonas mexicana]WBX95218.1 potassium channel family protein [Pseudoxanthomonas mexicana]